MNLAPEVMKEIFEIAECLYALKNELKIKSKKIHSVTYGIETVFLLALESGTVYPVTLKSGNPLNFSNQKSKIGFLKTALANFGDLTSNELAMCKLRTKRLIIFYDFFLISIRLRGRSTSHVTPGM